MRKLKYIKSFLESSRRKNIDREIDGKSFDEIYDSLLGGAYFKFKNYETWSGKFDMIDDDATNRILDSLPISEIFNSYEDWKKSSWYNTTEFPFSSKDWTEVSADGGEKFKWHSTGHKMQEKSSFEKYFNKYGAFIVVDLSDKI